MAKTLFERILAREIPGQFLYEDGLVFVIRDIEPKAPFHALVIPVKPIPSLAEVGPEDGEILAALLVAARRVASENGLVNGWRLVANVGEDAGISVPHLHFHLLGGRPMDWPPG